MEKCLELPPQQSGTKPVEQPSCVPGGGGVSVCTYPSENFKVLLGPFKVLSVPTKSSPQEQVLKMDEKKIFICVVNNRL